MRNIRHNVSLRTFNTLGLDVVARHFVSVTSLSELSAALAYADEQQLRVRVLGGGSNLVLGETIDDLVLHCCLAGVERSGNVVYAGGGENWHQLVTWCVAQGLSGIENLALIPGSVGAAPVQNIGAYGQEVATLVSRVDAVEIATGHAHQLTGEQCQFAYRDSIFKQAAAGQYVITGVQLTLGDRFVPVISYPDLRRHFQVPPDTPGAVMQAVIAIRQRKLPDPQATPNVGSFFTNPLVTATQYARLAADNVDLAASRMDSGDYKLSAAWLIDQAGLKGKSLGGAAVSSRHALVIVNTGAATPADVRALAALVQREVRERFGVSLDIEPTRW